MTSYFLSENSEKLNVFFCLFIFMDFNESSTTYKIMHALKTIMYNITVKSAFP